MLWVKKKKTAESVYGGQECRRAQAGDIFGSAAERSGVCVCGGLGWQGREDKRERAQLFKDESESKSREREGEKTERSDGVGEGG
jgi:hypothetical protein